MSSRSLGNSTSSVADRARWGEFLDAAVDLSQASGGAIWEFESGRLRLSTQVGLGDQPLDLAQQNWPGHSEKLADVVRTRQTKSLLARFEPEGHGQGSAQDLQLLLVPLAEGESVDAIVELFLPDFGRVPVEQVERSILQLARWQSRTEQGANGSADSVRADRLANWLAQIHASLDLEETVVRLANETRTWSRWDRVTVAVRVGPVLQIRCISGLESFDRRAGAVRQLEELLNVFRRRPEPLIVMESESSNAIAGGLETPVGEYLQRVLATDLVLLPLFSSPGRGKQVLIGALVFENFGSHEHPASEQRITTPETTDAGSAGRFYPWVAERRPAKELEFASQQAAPALEHALDYERARMSVASKAFRQMSAWPFLRRVLLAMCLVGVALAMCLIRVESTITGTGILEPERQQDIFAVAPGIVEKLSVKHGEDVAAGADLLTLRSVELEFEINKLEGELQTVRQQIADLDALRSDPRRSAERAQYGSELAARAEEYRSVQKNLEQQLAILGRQREELVLRSPLSGHVITWDLEKLLASRPVQRADRLLTIADLNGPWVVRLQVDHRDTGPVLAAARQGDLGISFVTSAAPDRPISAELREVAPSLTVDSISGTTLSLLADVDRQHVPDARPGTTVQFRIRCADAPVGYVWFRRLIDRVTAWWALW